MKELLNNIDMKELESYNPKLHQKLSESPELILDLKESMLEIEAKGDMMAEVDALNQAAIDPLTYRPRVYAFPMMLAPFAPVFGFGAMAIIKLQAFTTIPWLPFLIMLGAGVRISILPLMVKQMTLVNKVGQASPNIRLAMAVFKKSKMRIDKRLYYLIRSIYEY